MSSYRSRVALVASLMIAATLLAVAAVHVSPRPYAARPVDTSIPTRALPSATATAPASAAPTGTAPPPKVNGIAWLDIAVVVAVGFVLLVSVIGLVVALVGLLRRLGGIRPPRRRHAGGSAPPAPRPERVDPEVVATAVEAGLAELSGGEPDDAIIACWVRFSETAHGIGVEDRRSDTAQDLVARVAGTGRVHSDAVDRLAALYREARFSTHPMTEADRDAARAALETVRAELRGVRA